ncbi:hypothetical protein P4118_01495 [Pseudomonas aeruginosa]|nr:hypothetical protein [Pseudomonas aeruginosa]
MRRQSNTGFAWPAPTPRGGRPLASIVHEAGETLDAGDQQAIQALLLAASRNRLLWLAEAQQHPRGFVLAHLWQTRGRSGTGRRDRRALRIGPQARRQGLARELVGSAEEALRRAAPA